MGGVMKSGYGHMHATYNSSRRRWNVYVLMGIMVLVFGCGILGVIGVQRLKDRRVLDQLIKEKDDRIISLHLLSQKEREHMKEVQSKTEEMKMKIYNLQAQKTQLNNRLLEMQSTISSLKEEQRTIELAFQELQNEAKLLRERYTEIQDQNPQVKALTEILKQKEAEIEYLKHHLQLPVRTDEASFVPSNVTAKANVSGTETVINMHESSMQSEEQRENGILVEGRGETTKSEKFDRLENSQERSAENIITDVVQNGRKSETGRENKERETEMNENLGREEQKTRERDSQGLATIRDAHSSKISKYRDSDNQELRLHKVRLRGKYSYLRRAKGEKWRPITNGQRLDTGAAEISNKLQEGTSRNQGIQDSVMGLGMQKESALKNQQFRTDDKLPDAGQDNAKASVRGYNEENNGEESEDSPPGIMLQNRIEPVDTDETSYTDSSSIKSHISSSNATIQHTEDGQSKEKDIITEHMANKNEGRYDNNPGQTADAETNENSDNTQMQNLEGSKLGTITSTGSARDSSEEEEQTDETEF